MIQTDLILTQDQEIVCRKIEKFLSSDERIFRLRGRAGTGKTTVIKYALKKYLDEDMAKGPNQMPNVAGITLAHKARKVLSGSVPFSRSFASAYGFKETILDDGRRIFEPKKFFNEKPIGHLPIPIFVHDEISQYSQSMQDIFLRETSLFSKIILMGDDAQLPPIDAAMKPDADSPVFDIPLPEWCQHTLTERIRQKDDHPILALSDIVIEEIFGSKNLNRVIIEILKPKLYDGRGFICMPEKQVIDSYLDGGNFLMNKMIAFRNKAVVKKNDTIRHLLFPNASQSLIKNDLVFMTNNFVQKDPFFFKLENSDEFYVDTVQEDMFDVPGAYEAIHCYKAPIETDFKGSYLITPSDEGQYVYDMTLERLKDEALQNGSLWKRFYAFKDSFTEFTMGYALNAYRSQGSTYQNVYIDLIDILTTTKLTPKRKLQTIYTILTRATDKAVFIKP